MILNELEHLQSFRDHSEQSEIRSYLAKYRKASGDGNPIGLELRIVKAPKKPRTIVIYGYTLDFGAAKWFPALLMATSPRIERIMLECEIKERYDSSPERKPNRNEWDEIAPSKPPKFDKVTLRIVGGPKRGGSLS